MGTIANRKSLSAKVVALLTSVALVLSFIPCMALPQVALAEDTVSGEATVFTVYTTDSDGSNQQVAKAYTQAELEALVDSSADAIAGQYVKGGSMGVWASDNYVTFADLFIDASVSWGAGYTAKWGGSPEKPGNVFTYEQLQGRQFLPAAAVDKTTGDISFSAEGAVDVEPALALTAHRAFASKSEGDSATAAEAKAAALASTDAATALVPIIGASAAEIEGMNPAGKPYWTGTDSITVVAPAPVSAVSLATNSTQVHAGQTFDVTVAVTYDGSISAAQADIAYNPSVATISSIKYADGIENGYADDFNNETGKAKVSFLGDASFDAKAGVAIATITFTAVAAGDASITVSNAVATATGSATDIDLADPEAALVVPVADAIVFTVYTTDSDGANQQVAKAYTQAELEALVDSSADAIAGQYVKGGSMGVWASDNYVTFADLLADAGATWGAGYTAKWGGSPGKPGNAFTYEQLQGRQFLPAAAVDKATGEITFSAEGAVAVEPALALTAHRAFASKSEGDSATAAQAKAAALASTAPATELVPIIGASAEEIEGMNPAGKPYWTGTDSITIAAPADFAVSAEPFANGYYKVTYTAPVLEGMVVYMDGTPMILDEDNDHCFVALATKDQADALKNASFTVADVEEGGVVPVVYRNGDMNDNGKVNIVDAQIAYDLACGVYTDFAQVSMQQWIAGDVNNDNVLDAADAFAIQYKVHHGAFATE